MAYKRLCIFLAWAWLIWGIWALIGDLAWDQAYILIAITFALLAMAGWPRRPAPRGDHDR